MRRLLFLLGVLCLLAGVAQSEEAPYLVDWTVRLGGQGRDYFTDFALSAQDGLFLVGQADSPGENALGGTDGWVVRVDEDGEPLWSRRFGGSGEDRFTHVLLLEGEDLLIVGTTSSTDGDIRNQRGEQDAWCVRVSGEGELLWQKCLGGNAVDELWDATLFQQEQAVLAGRTRSRNGDLGSNHGGYDAWACAIELETGRSVWHYRYGGEGDDQFDRVLSDEDGWMLLGREGALSDQIGSPDAAGQPVLVSLDTGGKERFNATFNVSWDVQVNAVALVDDGWVLAGQMVVDGSQVWVSHLTREGSLLWQVWHDVNPGTAVLSASSYDQGVSILFGATGSVGDRVPGVHGGQDLWVLALDEDSNSVWQQALGGTADSWPVGLARRGDGRFLVVGTTASQDGDITEHEAPRAGWIALLESNGNLDRQLLLAPYADQTLTNLLITQDEGLYLLGEIHEQDRISAWITRLEPLE